MIIYCAGPIRGDAKYQDFYLEIIKAVESMGHSALAELNGKYNSSIPLTDKQLYTRDMKWIDGSAVMIAEISGPSLGVGFEISYALFQRKIPVLALYNAEVERVSAMISGCVDNNLTIKSYKDKLELLKEISSFLQKIKK